MIYSFNKTLLQFHRVPPVLFEELLKMGLPEELRRGIDELLEVKRVTDEIKDDRQKEWDTLNQVFLTV